MGRPQNTHEKNDDNHVMVYLRLRPMNKLETSKRSKDCIELHDDPKAVTIDSPLQGLYDYQFDMVFDEYASQKEVYDASLSSLPDKLRDGVNCSVLAYGQTSTGKTHTMMGEAQGAEFLLRSKRTSTADSPVGDEQPSQGIDPLVTEGMIPRLVTAVFEMIDEQPASVESTVRCSFVEIYLEKITDLLQPSRQGVRVAEGEESETCLVGASELCCLNPEDVYTLLSRGNAYRTKAATEQNCDSSRSHSVFSLKLEQIDRITGKYKSGRLLMMDLAGSEQGKTKSARQVDSPLAMESRMVSASLQSLFNYIRAKLAEQGKEKGRFHPNAFASVSKLTKLLKPCFGGNCFTSIICTASPSSYNIGETLNTVRFAQKARLLRNFPKPLESLSVKEYRTRLTKSERRVDNLTRFAKLLAVECRTVRKTGKIKQPHNVWDVISRIAKASEDEHGSDLVISVSGKEDEGEEKVDVEASVLEEKVKGHRLAREKAESSMRDFQSELSSMKAQHELVSKERDRLEGELSEAKNELKALSLRKEDVEVQLRTSVFREKEAVVFLRQFRTFYLRLLKSKAAQGSGGTDEVISELAKDMPGVPDLTELMDIDKLMSQSGLIEEEEFGGDTNSPEYAPSNDAIARSTEASEHAEQRQKDGRPPNRTESGYVSAYHQKQVESPAGKLALKMERELEQSVVNLSTKCVTLQNNLNAEKAMVEALSARQGALGKRKTAQEMTELKAELERKSNDMQAIIWKMNEDYLVRKTVNEKLENRDVQVARLDEQIVDLQDKNRRLLTEKLETEKRLKEDCFNVTQKLEAMAVKLWQLGETKPEGLQYWKLIVPSSGETVNLNSKGTRERRISLGDVVDEGIEILEYSEKKTYSSTSTQTDEKPTMDSETQTEVNTRNSETQTDLKSTKNRSAQTQIETVSSAAQTDDQEVVVSDAEVQTEPEEVISNNSDVCTQTDGTVRMEVACATIDTQTEDELQFDVAVQTDEIEADRSNTAEAEGGDNPKSNPPPPDHAERKSIMMDSSTQTDDLPKEIALHTVARSIESVSLGEEDLKVPTEIGRPPKPTKPGDKNLSRSELTVSKSDDGSAANNNSASSLDSLGILRSDSSPTTRVKTKWAATNVEDKLGASMSSFFTSKQKGPDWRNRLRQKGEAVPSTPTPSSRQAVTTQQKGGLPRAPLAGALLSGSKKRPSKKDDVPEFLSKFKEMGIKDGEHDDEDANIVKVPEFVSKFKEMGIKADENDEEEEEVPEPAVEVEKKQPEWMQRFKEIGMKGEEKVVEGVVGETGGNSAPAEADHAPEWMKKAKQIGQKRGEGTGSLEGKPAGFQPRRSVDKFSANMAPSVTKDKK